MKATKFQKPKPIPVRELLAGNLPTTTPGVSVLVIVGYSNETYFAAAGSTPPPASATSLPMVVLASRQRFSAKTLATWARQALDLEIVRQRVHSFCSEQGLSLVNPVF